ncbi:MAG: hypothetical protein WCH31_06985 [Actinomycetes bacterium]
MAWHDWIRTVEIEPALARADPRAREVQVEALLRTGCRVFHLDASDATPVWALAPLLQRYGGVLDVHLHAVDPVARFGELAAAGAQSVTVDLGLVPDAADAVDAAHRNGLQAGIALRPGDPPSSAAAADIVVVDALDVRRVAAGLPLGTRIQAEGDVDHDNVADLYAAGATLLVVGEPIFSREDLPRAYRRLVQALA